jgi:hypothetical protein
VLFIGPENQRTSGQEAYVWWFLPSGPVTPPKSALANPVESLAIHPVKPCMVK